MLSYSKFYICSNCMRLVTKIKVASLGLQAYFKKARQNWSLCGYLALKSHLTHSKLIICMEPKADMRCSMWFSLLCLVKRSDNCAEQKPAHGLKKKKKKKKKKSHFYYHFVPNFYSHSLLFFFFLFLVIYTRLFYINCMLFCCSEGRLKIDCIQLRINKLSQWNG